MYLRATILLCLAAVVHSQFDSQFRKGYISHVFAVEWAKTKVKSILEHEITKSKLKC